MSSKRLRLTVSPPGAGQKLRPGQDADLGVAKRDPFEIRVVRRAHVEKRIVAVAVEDDLAVTGGPDRDRSLGRAVAGEVVRAVERRRAVDARVVRVFVAVVPVDARMHENRVSGANPGPAGRRPVGARAPEIVGAHQAFEGRLDLRTVVAVRIDVKDAPTGPGLGLRARAHGQYALGRAAHAVGIRHHEADFVFRVGFEVEHTAGEHVRRDQVDARFCVDAFALQAQQRHGLSPPGLSLRPVRDRHGRIAVRILLDEPFEPEIVQGRRFGQQLPGHDGFRRRGRRGLIGRDLGPGRSRCQTQSGNQGEKL